MHQYITISISIQSSVLWNLLPHSYVCVIIIHTTQYTHESDFMMALILFFSSDLSLGSFTISIIFIFSPSLSLSLHSPHSLSPSSVEQSIT